MIISKFCSFDGCSNRQHGRGYCATHNWQLKNKSELTPIKKLVIRTGCTEKGCSNSHAAKGLCKKHYQQKKSPENKIKRLELKKEVFSHYSKKLSNSDIPCCNCCGENKFLIFLTIDHVKGRDDLPDKEKDLMGSALYAYLKRNNYPPEYQVLCINCNSAKSDFDECPHKRSKQ
jgi:hypothetical protein